MCQLKFRFSYHSGVGAKLICWRDWSDYSHVDLIMPSGGLLGAKGDGVKIREVDSPVRFVDLSIEVTQEQYSQVILLAMRQLGKPYDYAGVIGFVFNRNWEEDDKWFCAELVLWLLKSNGVELLRTNNTHRYSARDLMLSPKWNK